MKETVKVEGLRELEAALSELPKSTGKAVLRRIGKAALEPVARDAAALAPDDPTTGPPDLRTTIGVSQTLSRSQRRAMRKETKSSIEVYAGPAPRASAVTQEFGTVNHPAHPFMRPAWDKNKGGVLKYVADNLGGEIKKAADRLARKAARLIAKNKAG